MFGIFGMAIYSIAYIIGWSTDEQREQKSRLQSKERDLPFYIDKKGKKRWVSTGKRYTSQEIYQEHINIKERNKRAIERKLLESYKRDYELDVKRDIITFEEFVATHFYPQLAEYETFCKIKESVSEERIREIKETPPKLYKH